MLKKNVFFILILICFSNAVLCSDLKSFEKDALKTTTKVIKSSPRRHSRSYSHGHSSYFWAEVFAEIFFWAMIYGGAASVDRVSPYSNKSLLKPRAKGDSLLSFFKLDTNFQILDSDIYALDNRAETGWGPFGVQLRYTHYNEIKPNDELDSFQFHFLYRMSLADFIELDLGVGSITINGVERNSGYSYTIPFTIYFNKHIGMELRPTYSEINGNDINDFDFSMLISFKFISMRAGYRWFETINESLDGPYIGASMHF